LTSRVGIVAADAPHDAYNRWLDSIEVDASPAMRCGGNAGGQKAIGEGPGTIAEGSGAGEEGSAPGVDGSGSGAGVVASAPAARPGAGSGPAQATEERTKGGV